jgi:hypothetical protein
MRTSMLVLCAALAGAGLFAIVHSDSTASARDSATTAESPPAATALPALPPQETSPLPPGHPDIGARNGVHGSAPTPADEPSAPAITWTAPTAWTTSPSASAMRLASYRIPRASGETEDTELSVVRAGGSVDANIARWVGQFEEAGKDTRTVKTIRGMPVTIVEVRGTFLGGGMAMGGSSTPHPGWALLAAIVETPGSPYFFKMTGPAKSVSAARPDFDALLASVAPSAR